MLGPLVLSAPLFLGRWRHVHHIGTACMKYTVSSHVGAKPAPLPTAVVLMHTLV
jgi:hypothetical protein